MQRKLRAAAVRASRAPRARAAYARLPYSFRVWLRSRLLATASADSRSLSAEASALLQALKWYAARGMNLPEVPELDLQTDTIGPQITRYVMAKDVSSVPDDAYVTVDLWDTLVARVRPAEGVKRGTALRIAFADWENRDYKGPMPDAELIHMSRLEVEDQLVKTLGEARVRDVLRIVVQRLGLRVDSEAIVELEVRDEVQHSRPTAVWRDISSRNVDAVVSDHYLSADDLRAIMSGVLGMAPSPGVVLASSEHLVSKRTKGLLFDRLDRDEADDWWHIGDNPHSDVDMAESRGANAVLVVREMGTSWNAHEMDPRSLARDLPEHLGQRSSCAGTYLVHVAALSYGLVTLSSEIALQRGSNRVVYLSREGQTLKQAHDVINGVLSEQGFPTVQAVHLPSSRASLHFPSLAPNTRQGLEAVQAQYPLMSSETLSATMSLSPSLAEAVETELGRHRLERPTVLWDSLPMSLRDQIREFHLDQRAQITRLVSDLDVDRRNMVVCDLGWRGTMQQALGRILDAPVVGAYLGVRAPWSTSSPESEMFGLAFDEPKSRGAGPWFDFVGPLERAFTMTSASVARYQSMGSTVECVLDEQQDGPSPERRHLMNSALVPTLVNVTNAMVSVGLYGRATNAFVDEIVRQWMHYPTPMHAHAWFDEVHAEPFGAGSRVHYEVVRPSEKWLKPGFRKEAMRALTRSQWPEGYLSWMPVSSVVASVQ